MKKFLAILLSLVLVFALLAACNSGDSSSGGDAQGGEGGDANLGGKYPSVAGFFDASFDYTQHDKYKIAYLVSATNFLYDEFDKAFRDWAPRMNITYAGMFAASGGSADELLSMIQTYSDQGYSGIIIDADTTLYPQIVDLTKRLGLAWMPGMGQARDTAEPYTYGDYAKSGRLIAPSVGFEQQDVGVGLTEKLIQWKNETWPNVPWSKVGLIALDFSLSPELHDRVNGMERRWSEVDPSFGEFDPDVSKNPKNFFYADSATAGFDQASAANLITQAISSDTSGIEVWLVPALFDDFSMGAASAADNLGITDKLCTVCFGGSSLPVQWDAGVQNAWRYAWFTAQSVYAEPIIAGLWAQMSGQANQDQLWPEWRRIWDKGDVLKLTDKTSRWGSPLVEQDDSGKGTVIAENFYPTLQLAAYWLDHETYKTYLEWTDLYAYGPGQAGHYNYEPVTDLSLFESRITPPASYTTYPEKVG